jgi:zinc protease
MHEKILHIEFEKYRLGNGLQVILYPDSLSPLIAVNLWYRVGSANEKPGKTGFAHLFEHMMFQGSEHIPKEGHFKYIQEAGGSLNGSTSIDRTNYYETLPANSLELALWLESDRMGFLLPALTQDKLDNQKSVVMNERRQRYENQPYGLSWEKLFSSLYSPDHPYHWPTIGWMADIEKFELDEVKKFSRDYYVPDNAALAVGGSFDRSKTMDLIEDYFGSIPQGKPVPEINAPPQWLGENKKVIYEDDVQLPRLHLAWHSAKAFGNDDAELDLLADILTGSKNSRLHKSLLFDKQIAQDVSAFQYSGRQSGSFIITATAKPGVQLDLLRGEIFKEIEKLTSLGISAEELTRTKNNVKSHFVFSLQKLDLIVDHMNHYNFFLDNPGSFQADLDRYEKVTAENIIAGAKKYLLNPFVELRIIPKSQ